MVSEDTVVVAVSLSFFKVFELESFNPLARWTTFWWAAVLPLLFEDKLVFVART